MAFLCPVRMRRSKKKKPGEEFPREPPPPLGRITGSASVETLVRVGLEKEHGLSPESKMVVLHDFTPYVDDELEVKRGSVVNVLYQENDWVYVIDEDGRREGFIPHSYCAPYGSPMAELALNVKLKKVPRPPPNPQTENLPGKNLDVPPRQGGLPHHKYSASTATPTKPSASSGGGFLPHHSLGSGSDGTRGHHTPGGPTSSALGSGGLTDQGSQSSSLGSQSEAHPFYKDPMGRFIVLYTFIARDENDVSVERGEFVTALNREDEDWFWVLRSDGQEGFVPSAFLYPAEAVQDVLSSGPPSSQASTEQAAPSSKPSTVQSGGGGSHSQASKASAPDGPLPQGGAGTYHGTELVMLYDYKAQAPDDLSVRRGDWVYADLNQQTVDGWLWAYSPQSRTYGFIPRAYARPPAMTSL